MRLRYLTAWGFSLVLTAGFALWLVAAGHGIRSGSVALVAALIAVALVCYLNGLTISSTLVFDASFVSILLATVLIGPTAGAVVAASLLLAEFAAVRWAPESWSTGPRPIRHVAMAINVASYALAIACGWAALSGTHSVLDSFAGEAAAAYPAMLVAGVCFIAMNFASYALLLPCLADAKSFDKVTHDEFTPGIPNYLFLIALGTLTAFLYNQIGLPALALFALIVVVPERMFLPKLQQRYENALKAKPIDRLAGLDRWDRTAAIATQMARLDELGKDAEKTLCLAAEFLRQENVNFPPGGREEMTESQLNNAQMAMWSLRFRLSYSSFQRLVEADRKRMATAAEMTREFGEKELRDPTSRLTTMQRACKRELESPARSLVPFRVSDDPDGRCFEAAKEIAAQAFECDSGGGWPSGLHGGWRDPLAAYLQVAFSVAGWQLEGKSEAEIAMELRDRAGTQFKPKAVKAAIRLLAEERAALQRDVAFEPRLHSLPPPSAGLRLAAPIFGLQRAASERAKA